MTGRKKDFHQREGLCVYCEYEGNLLVFENSLGEETEVCGGCLEEALEELNEDFLPREF